jgi:hypothetical protein
MLSFFQHKTHIKKLLFLFSLCTKVKKILRKWTKKYVQKSIPRYLFVKKRAVLGNLRNFFNGTFMRPFMLRIFLMDAKMQKVSVHVRICAWK